MTEAKKENGMSERTEYAPGEFCWVSLATTDVEGAKDFYARAARC